MKKRINMGGEFYMADFGYFSMSVYMDDHLRKLMGSPAVFSSMMISRSVMIF